MILSFFAAPQEMPMYTPKIRGDLIPRLYRAAKARKVPMTRLVSALLETALGQLERETEANPQQAVKHHSPYNARLEQEPYKTEELCPSPK